MNLQIYSSNFAENILSQEPFKDTYNDLIWICENIPLPVYKNKSTFQKKLDVIQQLMDTYINKQLRYTNWDCDIKYEIGKDEYLSIDYLKTINTTTKDYHLHLEVEFGNVASAYRNYFKMQYLNLRNTSDISFLLLPTESLAKRIDSGIATFEKSVNELIHAKELFDFPIVLIGLDDSHTIEWDMKDSPLSLKEMQSKISSKHEVTIIEYIEGLRRN
jgi:hypothetical protein